MSPPLGLFTITSSSTPFGSLARMSTSPLAIAGLFVSVFGVMMIWEHLESWGDLDPSLGKGSVGSATLPLPLPSSSPSSSPALTLKGDDELGGEGGGEVLWKEEEDEFEEEKTLKGGEEESQLKSWRTRCMELESEKEEFKGRVKVLEEDLDQSRKDRGRLREKLKEKVGEMGSMKRRRGERILSAEMEQRLKERIELKKELKKVWEARERALNEVERMKHELEDRDAVVATLRKSLEEAEEYGGQVPGLQRVLDEVRHRLEEKRHRHWWRRSSSSLN